MDLPEPNSFTNQHVNGGRSSSKDYAPGPSKLVSSDPDKLKLLLREKMNLLGLLSNQISALDAVFEQSYIQTKKKYEQVSNATDLNLQTDDQTKKLFFINVTKRFLYDLKE